LAGGERNIAERHGKPQDMREAMATIARAGLLVPRQSSKFAQPAFTFRVAARAYDRPAD
jgi:hypothetical protein